MADTGGNVARTRANSAPLGFIEPELATLTDAMPAGPDWVHEVKFDGYRTITVIENGRVRMFSRSGLDWTDKYQALAEHLAALDVATAVLDGEIVALNEHGVSSFSKLKDELGAGRSTALQYYIFDLMVLDGNDLRPRPLLERKAALERLLKTRDFKDRIIYSEHFTEAQDLLPHLCSLDMEGIISKRVDAPYSGKRSKAWLKVKCHKRQEFVIVGFTDSKHAGRGFRSLLLGYYDAGQLKFAGKVGTGFTGDSLAMIRDKLDQLEIIPKPFAKLPPDVGRGTWVEPKLVCEVEFTEWTPEGRLRHPSFQGLREDKAAKAVGRERAVPLAKVTAQADGEIAREVGRRK